MLFNFNQLHGLWQVYDTFQVIFPFTAHLRTSIWHLRNVLGYLQAEHGK